MNLTKTLLAAAASFLLAAAAHADPKSLATPPLQTVGGGRVTCAIVNVGHQTRQVKIQVLLGNATTPALDERDVELAPREAAELLFLDQCSNGGCGPYYCEFKVQGPTRAYRAALCVRDVADKVCLPAE
jgi:hypothetical protein